LTLGGIGCGKSTVSRYLNEVMKIPIIDCDVLSRRIFQQGEAAYKQVVQRFGQGILDSSGNIDRKRLGQIVFEDAKQRRKLTSITSKYIFLEIAKEAYKIFFKNRQSIAVLDAPVLFETVILPWFCFPNVVIYLTDEEEQIKRIVERDGMSEEEARKRIKSQMPLQEKIRKSDIHINNAYSIEELNSAVVSRLSTFLVV
jgi:dephospho-CoA kinase